MPYKRRKYHQGITTEKKKYRTKRRQRDIDQIFEDLEPAKRQKLESQPLDLDKPGGGQFYCVHCAKHFIDEHSLQEHIRGKVHKRRVKDLQIKPYSIEESERAAGLGSYVLPTKEEKTSKTMAE